MYEHRDKTDKLLYWLATREIASRIVPEILDSPGQRKYCSIEIATVFEYYRKLYALQPWSLHEQTG